MRSLGTLAASGLLAWYLMVPPASSHDDANSFASPSNAQADDSDMSKWTRFGSELKSKSECETERNGLLNDPVIGRQMKHARCVQDDQPSKS